METSEDEAIPPKNASANEWKDSGVDGAGLWLVGWVCNRGECDALCLMARTSWIILLNLASTATAESE